MKRNLLVPVLAALTLAVTTPACAQARRGYGYGYPGEAARVPYDRGYQEGVREGEKDGRSRDPFRYQDERDFQRGDVGYDRVIVETVDGPARIELPMPHADGGATGSFVRGWLPQDDVRIAIHSPGFRSRISARCCGEKLRRKTARFFSIIGSSCQRRGR